MTPAPNATQPGASSTPGCKVVAAGDVYVGRQNLTYRAGLTGDTVGASGICMTVATLPPAARAKAHLHRGIETAVYVIEGEATTYFGSALEQCALARAGEYVYIPADVPHLVVNQSSGTCRAVIAHTAANDQEGIVLLPELDDLVPSPAATDAPSDVARTIIAMERAALERWGRGDPSGFLEISAEDVVYFDPYQPRRLDGLAELRSLYESIRGNVQIDRFEILDPKVQAVGDMAVLTFNYVAESANEPPSRWNCTEVYRRDAAGWRIIQTHWSFTAATASA